MTEEMKTDLLKGKVCTNSPHKAYILKRMEEQLLESEALPTWNIDVGITQRYEHPTKRYLMNHLGFVQLPEHMRCEVQRIRCLIPSTEDYMPPEPPLESFHFKSYQSYFSQFRLRAVQSRRLMYQDRPKF